MKKLFLAGVLAASMAVSSTVAFATDDFEYSYDVENGTVSVDTDLSETYEGQLTILVLDGDGTTVSQATIEYIDQETAASDIFQDMGLLNGLTPGEDYTIKIGGDEIVEILSVTFTVPEDQDEGIEFTFKFGDVDGSDSVNVQDAMAIIAYYIGAGADALGCIFAMRDARSIHLYRRIHICRHDHL